MLIVTGSSSAAQPAPWHPLSDAQAIEGYQKKWERLDPHGDNTCEAEQFLHAKLADGKTIHQAARDLARHFGLRGRDALELSRLLVARIWLGSPTGPETSERPAISRAIYTRFVRLTRRAGKNPAIWDAVICFAWLGGRCRASLYGDLVAPAPGALVRGYALAKTMRCPTLMGQLNQLDPGNMAIAWHLAKESFQVRPSRKLALLERLRERLSRAGRDSGLFDFGVEVHREYIYLLVDLGQADRAIQVFEQLEAPIKAALQNERTKPLTIEVGGLQLSVRPEWSRDLNPREADGTILLEIAAAHAIMGDRARAAEILGSLPWTGPSLDALIEGDGGRRYRQSLAVAKALLLERITSGSQEDPYPWVRMTCGASRCSRLASSYTWSALAKGQLGGGGYRDLIRWYAEVWGRTWIPMREAREEDPATFASFGQGFEERSDKYRRSIFDLHKTLQDEWGVREKFQAAIRRPSGIVLRGQTGTEFDLRPMPADERSPAPTREALHRQTPLPPDVAPLPGHRVVRFERSRDLTVAITTPEHKDPTSLQGVCWLHLSHDLGKSWSEHVPLPFPYGLKPESKHPLIAHGRLEPEVVGYHCTFVPVVMTLFELRLCRPVRDVYASVPLEEVLADTDGDGLTDLYERHLLLNPLAPDSDGDTVPDGADPAPTLPFSTDTMSDMGWVTAFFSHLVFHNKLISLIRDPVRQDPFERVLRFMSLAVEARQESPIVIQADRIDTFRAYRASRPLVVLTPEQVRQAILFRGEERSHLAPINIVLVVFNRTQTKGFVIWSRASVGGTIEVTKTSAGWVTESIYGWIS